MLTQPSCSFFWSRALVAAPPPPYVARVTVACAFAGVAQRRCRLFEWAPPPLPGGWHAVDPEDETPSLSVPITR